MQTTTLGPLTVSRLCLGAPIRYSEAISAEVGNGVAVSDTVTVARSGALQLTRDG